MKREKDFENEINKIFHTMKTIFETYIIDGNYDDLENTIDSSGIGNLKQVYAALLTNAKNLEKLFSSGKPYRQCSEEQLKNLYELNEQSDLTKETDENSREFYSIIKNMISKFEHLKEIEEKPHDQKYFCIKMTQEFYDFEKKIEEKIKLNKFAIKNLELIKFMLSDSKFKISKGENDNIITNIHEISSLFENIHHKIKTIKDDQKIMGKKGPLGIVEIKVDSSKYFIELYEISENIVKFTHGLKDALKPKPKDESDLLIRIIEEINNFKAKICFYKNRVENEFANNFFKEIEKMLTKREYINCLFEKKNIIKYRDEIKNLFDYINDEIVKVKDIEIIRGTKSFLMFSKAKTDCSKHFSELYESSDKIVKDFQSLEALLPSKTAKIS